MLLCPESLPRVLRTVSDEQVVDKSHHRAVPAVDACCLVKTRLASGSHSQTPKIDVVVTYGDIPYISVQARLYLKRSSRLMKPLPLIPVQSVTRKLMLINSALSFSEADRPISYCDYHWEQALPVFSYPAFTGTMVIRALRSFPQPVHV